MKAKINNTLNGSAEDILKIAAITEYKNIVTNKIEKDNKANIAGFLNNQLHKELVFVCTGF